MNRDSTDITLVVDRSGSMASVREDAEGGVNTFIRSQAELPGEVNVTLVQFDTEYEFFAKGVPAGKMKPYKLTPGGCTALLDAVGRAINETDQRLSSMPEADRPGLVVFVAMADGPDNSSCEFTKRRIKQMIQDQTSKYNWQFTFLGAHQDTLSEATAMGINASGVVDFTKRGVRMACTITDKKVARMRRQPKPEGV